MPLIRVTSPENSFTAEQKAQLAPLSSTPTPP